MNPDICEPILPRHPVGSAENTDLPLTMVIYDETIFASFEK